MILWIRGRIPSKDETYSSGAGGQQLTLRHAYPITVASPQREVNLISRTIQQQAPSVCPSLQHP